MALAGGAAADESRRQFTALTRLSGLFADRIRALPVVLAFQAEAARGRPARPRRRRVAARAPWACCASPSSPPPGSSSSPRSRWRWSPSMSASICWACCPSRSPKRLDLGRGVFVLALAPEFYAPMRRLAAAYHDRQAAETAADRLMALEALAQRAASGPRSSSPRRRTSASRRSPSATRRGSRGARRTSNSRPGPARSSSCWARAGPARRRCCTCCSASRRSAAARSGSTSTRSPYRARSPARVAWMGQAPLIVAGQHRRQRRPRPARRVLGRDRQAARQAGLCAVLRRRGWDRPGGRARRRLVRRRAPPGRAGPRPAEAIADPAAGRAHRPSRPAAESEPDPRAPPRGTRDARRSSPPTPRPWPPSPTGSSGCERALHRLLADRAAGAARAARRGRRCRPAVAGRPSVAAAGPVRLVHHRRGAGRAGGPGRRRRVQCHAAERRHPPARHPAHRLPLRASA